MPSLAPTRTAVFVFAAALATALPAAAQTCRIDFTVQITQGVGDIRPGAVLTGRASYTPTGRSLRQEGGATAHLAEGRMRLGVGIEGRIWTLITTQRGMAADLVGVYASDVTGLSVAGIAFEGPMALALYGPPGTREAGMPPVTQAEWDRLTLRRAFALHAHGQDMLAGDVTRLSAACDDA